MKFLNQNKRLMKKEEKNTKKNTKKISRRAFFRYTASIGAVAGMSTILPAYAFAGFGDRDVLEPKGADNILDLTISEIPINIDGKTSTAIGINGSVPGPLIRLKEGEDVLLRVKNELKEDTSIHWHGIILPFQMDGVPGVSFDGIKPGETFEYRFPVTQNGTYWYHSHSKLQEQLGHYGPMIIEPKDVSEDGFVSAFKNYTSFGRMRMSPTDLADVTGATYTYLMNGRGPESNWNALFKKGEKIRLRFINGSAGSTFDVRIPGLKMTVVQADGQNIEPVSIEEFRIGIAETYDVIVEPKEEKAFTIFAESLDRSGFARGTLAPNEGMAAAVPVLRPRPTRTMKDMGMNMSDMKMDGMKMDNMEKKDNAMEGMDNGNMDHNMMGMSGMNSDPVKHGPDRHGVGAAAIADNQYNRLNEPGIGLGKDGRKVLVYNDLKSLEPNIDERKPEREVELHLTGNMERYMWSFDGKEFNEVKGPIELTQDERLRLILVNDTMMEHPIHLHGMWMELENENGIYNPRKHTLLVQPAQRISALVTPRDKGRWAFHCHILYHMEMGMFRVVQVSDKNGGIY